MNTRERFLAIMNFEEPDRNFVWEFGYWGGTVRRWYKEGLTEVHGLRDDIDGGVGLFNESAGVPLISPAMFREFILPGYKKLTGFLRDHGVNLVQVDSDGDVWKLIPLWMEGGVTVIYPFEVAAGMDVVEVRKAFPNLVITGGVDKRALVEGREAIDRELEYRIPFMLDQGGFIPTIDHMVSPDVSFENFKYYREKLNQMLKKHSRSWDRD